MDQLEVREAPAISDGVTRWNRRRTDVCPRGSGQGSQFEGDTMSYTEIYAIQKDGVATWIDYNINDNPKHWWLFADFDTRQTTEGETR